MGNHADLELTKFELAVMEHMLNGDEPNLSVLRAQLVQATICRTLTGVGFYVDFEVPDNCPKIAHASCHIGDVEAEIDGLVHGAGFVLFIADGKITQLEAYSYDEPWPENFQEYALKYSGSSQRTLPF